MTVVDDRAAAAVPNERTAEGEGRLYRSLGWYWHPVLYASQLRDGVLARRRPDLGRVPALAP